MSNNIVFGYSLERYNKKYRNCRQYLVKFTKKEVEDFDKKHNRNDKCVLATRKWALINDTYYEIPRAPRWSWYRNLNGAVQIAVPVLLIGGVTAGITTPIILNSKHKIVIEVPEVEIDDTDDCNIKFEKQVGSKYQFLINVKEESKDEVLLDGIKEIYIGDYKLKDNEYEVTKSSESQSLLLSIEETVLASHKGKLKVSISKSYKGPKLISLDVTCLATCSLDNALLRDDIEVIAHFEDSSEKKITKWKSKEFIGDKYTFKDDVKSQIFDITYRDITKELNVAVNKTFSYGKVTEAQWTNALKEISNKETRNFKIINFRDDPEDYVLIDKTDAYISGRTNVGYVYERLYKNVYWKFYINEFGEKFACSYYEFSTQENLGDLELSERYVPSFSQYCIDFVNERCNGHRDDYEFKSEETEGITNSYYLENDTYKVCIKFQPDKKKGTLPSEFYCFCKATGGIARYTFADFDKVDTTEWPDVTKFVLDTQFSKKEDGTNTFTYNFGEFTYYDYVYFAIDLKNTPRDVPDYNKTNIIRINSDQGPVKLDSSNDHIYSLLKKDYSEPDDFTTDDDHIVLQSGRIYDGDTLFVRLVGEVETIPQEPWHNAKFEFSYNIPE